MKKTLAQEKVIEEIITKIDNIKDNTEALKLVKEIKKTLKTLN